MKASTWRYRLDVLVSRIFTKLIAREFAHFGRSLVWRDAKIMNPQYMRIGDGVVVKARSWIYAVTSDHAGSRFTPSIEIGNGCRLGHGLHLTAVESVVVESEVSIADGVYISDNYHDYRDVTKPIMKQKVFSRGPLRIKAGAFIGEGARVIGPVTIGRNAVIGANAVVTRDIPDFSVAVGIPARVIQRHEAGSWVRVGGSDA